MCANLLDTFFALLGLIPLWAHMGMKRVLGVHPAAAAAFACRSMAHGAWRMYNLCEHSVHFDCSCAVSCTLLLPMANGLLSNHAGVKLMFPWAATRVCCVFVCTCVLDQIPLCACCWPLQGYALLAHMPICAQS